MQLEKVAKHLKRHANLKSHIKATTYFVTLVYLCQEFLLKPLADSVRTSGYITLCTQMKIRP